MSKSFLVVCVAILSFIALVLAVNAPSIYSMGHAAGIFCCILAGIFFATVYETSK